MRHKSLEATISYRDALQVAIGFLEDTSKDYLTPLEYILVNEWSKTNKRILQLTKQRKKK